MKLDSPKSSCSPWAPLSHVTLDITEGLVGVSAGLHGLVSRERPDLLLGLTLDRVADPLGVGLLVSHALGGLGLGLLGGTAGGEVGVSNGITDGFLGAAHVLVGGVGHSLGHIEKKMFGSGWFMCVCTWWLLLVVVDLMR